MGTRIQYAMNALATTPTSNSFSVSKIDVWNYFRSKALKEYLESSVANSKFKESMARRMIEQQKLESIKMTMLMHEDIFKHQVRELHRLYNIQKVLTVEMRNQETSKQEDKFWVVPITTTGSDHTSNYSYFLNRHQPTTTPCNQKIHIQSVLIENNMSSRERSGSCSGDQDQTLARMPKLGFDLERQPVIEAHQTGPSSYVAMTNYQTGKRRSSEESDVELTLSIGGGCKREKKSMITSEIGGESGGSNTSVGNSSASTIDQQNKWLFQGLSLNRT
ncbi:hypothetical protein RHMOL_Rhmol01G0000500 [Rhododendron molle]|uniref:Uncharacterized protein n=1 Tax=Rhododendron molle TaxID=49168 RepID=A0ACC0PX01_RHOML|nr:hypothetical protein RHMOL_Rhmol01G0000500 [Rhododendron molle]